MNSKLILGTVQFGLDYGINNSSGKLSKKSIFKILNYAYQNKIQILDTAESYGDSQKIIGEFIKNNPDKKFKIITKLSASKDLKSIRIEDEIEKNCKILGIDKLYGYMIHNISTLENNSSVYNKLLILKNKNKIEKIGISIYSNNEIENIIENFPGFDFIQIPFNLLDNELKRKTFILLAKQNGMEIHVRSVFLQGLFFKNINKFSRYLNPLIKYIDELNSISKFMNLDISGLALKYPLSKNYIDNVLIGVDSLDQLKINLNNSSLIEQFSFDKIDKINVLEESLLHPKNWKK